MNYTIVKGTLENAYPITSSPVYLSYVVHSIFYRKTIFDWYNQVVIIVSKSAMLSVYVENNLF